MIIFRKIVGAHSFTKKFQKTFNPTKKGLNPDFCMPLCLGERELSFVVLFGAFRRAFEEQNNFQNLWVSILTPSFNARWFFQSD